MLELLVCGRDCEVGKNDLVLLKAVVLVLVKESDFFTLLVGILECIFDGKIVIVFIILLVWY